jgi:hypothetical protein
MAVMDYWLTSKFTVYLRDFGLRREIICPIFKGELEDGTDDFAKIGPIGCPKMSVKKLPLHAE